MQGAGGWQQRRLVRTFRRRQAEGDPEGRPIGQLSLLKEEAARREGPFLTKARASRPQCRGPGRDRDQPGHGTPYLSQPHHAAWWANGRGECAGSRSHLLVHPARGSNPCRHLNGYKGRAGARKGAKASGCCTEGVERGEDAAPTLTVGQPKTRVAIGGQVPTSTSTRRAGEAVWPAPCSNAWHFQTALERR